MTSFGSEKRRSYKVSLNYTSYGYLRGPEGLAQALPKSQRSFKSYAMIGGTGAPPVIARLREATDKATKS